jgi:hypothetical protein
MQAQRGKHMQQSQAAGSRSVVGAIVLALFALVMAGASLLAGGIPLAVQLAERVAVTSWPAVPAQVLSSELRELRDSRQRVTTHRLSVRYRYQVQGRSHESGTVGLGFALGSDNFGDWHAHWHQHLRQAQATGTPVPAYVNPRRPEQAVLEPRLRGALVGVHLVFAVVLSGVALGLLWGMRRAWCGPSATPDPHAGITFCVTWLTAAWCCITVPLAAVVLMEGPLAAPQWAMVSSPAVGLAVAWGLQRARRARLARG